MEKTIEKIGQMEKEADQIVEQSNHQAFEIIQSSRDKRSGIIEDRKVIAEKTGTDKVEQAIKEARIEADKILKDSETTLKQISSLSQKNLNKAIDFIFRKIR